MLLLFLVLQSLKRRLLDLKIFQEKKIIDNNSFDEYSGNYYFNLYYEF